MDAAFPVPEVTEDRDRDSRGSPTGSERKFKTANRTNKGKGSSIGIETSDEDKK